MLAELGVPTDGLALLDGSGLARGSRIAPETLGALLALAAGTAPTPGFGRWSPACRSRVSPALSLERFGAATAAQGAGVVRAKTGTLTGVSSLAGVVARGDDSAGPVRLLAFALMTDDVQVKHFGRERCPGSDCRSPRWSGRVNSDSGG